MTKNSKLEKLNNRYEKISNKFVQLFCNKQKLDFDGWIGNEVGGIAGFVSQYFFDLSDIRLDLTTDQPVGQILDWQNENVNIINPSQRIDYKSYISKLKNK